MRLGQRLGLNTAELATLYDVSILTYVGCPVYGNEAAVLFGDDIDFRAATYDTDMAGPAAMKFMLTRAGAGTSAVNRARQAATLVATGGRGLVEHMANHCSAAGLLTERLGLSDAVRAGVEQSYARWDGRGVPGGLAGDALALSSRVSHVADACEVLQRTTGTEQAVSTVKARSGTHFDPQVVAALARDVDGLFAGLDHDTIDEVLDGDPTNRPMLTEDELDHAMETIGDFCDLRCPYFAGHARGTADLVSAAASLMQMPAGDVRMARRAALVHDVGRIGVPASVWNKPGRLSGPEWERMRMHVYYVERIFSRPEPLRRIGLLAATHHERMDGSGYHRGIGGVLLSASARVLAAADAYHAMTQPRPHRAARSSAEAAQQLREDAQRGRLDLTAAEAVLAAAGATRRRLPPGAAAGLTSREREVLGLLACGLPNKSIARQMGISAKTVGNHIEHIYSKLNVPNRASAAMVAMQHGLVGSSVPDES
jgi:HD-GYP domain-containing protein (c-di-GMP phosphodiesterase class II)